MDGIVDLIVDIVIKEGLLIISMISKAAEQHKRPRLKGSLSVIVIIIVLPIIIIIIAIIFDANDDKSRRCWKAGGW